MRSRVAVLEALLLLAASRWLAVQADTDQLPGVSYTRDLGRGQYSALLFSFVLHALPLTQKADSVTAQAVPSLPAR
jgi:hypothetical protein